jgi:signal transduction histidine kinase
VPDAERERIFEPFQRLGDELTRERAGVGLGLALVRGVAQAHGGEAGCSAREGGGSCFWLELPIAAAGGRT